MVKLRPKQWDHIVLGGKNGTGGHCFSHFPYRHSRKIFFDTQTNAYVIPTDDINFSDFFERLKVRRFFKCRSLFPDNVLTKDFVLDAFVQAKNKDQVYHNFFFTELPPFNVAGYVLPRKNDEFEILTLFPDVAWHQRSCNTRAQAIAPSRLLIWDEEKHVWARYLDLDMPMDEEDTTYWPAPIEILTMPCQ